MGERLLVLGLALTSFGAFVGSVLKLAGLTKTTTIKGGVATDIVRLLGNIVLMVGALAFIIAVFVYGDAVRQVIECVLG